MSRIEVMVTCYNYADYLRQCVESVLQQSHRDLRVLIVDDASTDDTPAVSAALAAADPRVALLRHPVNRGHIATYNECIDLAAADYLLILSADDFLLPGSLARAIAVLDANPAVGLVHGDWIFFHDSDALPAPDSGRGPARFPNTGRFIKRLALDNPVVTPTAVVRTALQQRVGHYDPALPHAGDVEMWLRLALHGAVAYIPDLQAAYRRHARNMSLDYDRVADLAQCYGAFRPHWDAVRRLPRGRLIAAQARRHLAIRQRGVANALLRQGALLPSLRNHLQSLGRILAARLLELRARLAPGP